MLRKQIYILLFFLFASSFVRAEIANYGVPNLIHYTKHDFNAGNQTWSVAQDDQGLMYFANNSGLLKYDGNRWDLYYMPNSSLVRSVFKSTEGEIYVGAYNELGKMVRTISGKLEFKSFKKYIPAEFQDFDDIWNIHSFDNQIVFQSYKTAFFFRNDSTVSVIQAPTRFQSSFQINGRLYFNDNEKGLLVYSTSGLVPMEGTEKLRGVEIWAMVPSAESNKLMIFTFNKGVFLYDGNQLQEWDVPVNSLFRKYQVFSATVIHDKYIAVGTIQDGLIIIDFEGNVSQHINKQKGLQNNTVLKVFADRNENLWLGLDNGIDYVNINSPITFLQETDDIGAGYTALFFKGKLYLGTNQGLYVKNWSQSSINEKFRLVEGTNGQVWYLGIHDDILLCGHNNGTYQIENEKARQISKIPGAWKFMKLKRFPEYLIGGTYGGLIYFEKQNGEWVYVDKVKGFDESFRIFEEDENGNIWMSHGYKGVYKIEMGDKISQIKSFRFFSTKDGLPKNYNLNVAKMRGKILVSSSAGLFEFNPSTDRFESSVNYNKLVSPMHDISYVLEDQKGNVWYHKWDTGKNETGVLRIQNDKSFINDTAPFALLTNKFVNGFEFIYPYAEGQVIFGVENGFAHYSSNSGFRISTDLSTYINRATALYLDSIFYYGNGSSDQKNFMQQDYDFPFKDNSFRFSFASPTYDNIENIEFSYKLIGYNDKWSEWSTSTFIEYAKLPPGTFTFCVKGRSQSDKESKVDELEFTIRPPWYLSVYAYVIYGFLFMALVLFVVWFLLKRIEVSKRKERLKNLRAYRQKEQEFKRQSLIAEKKIISLNNEKLKIEMIHRDKELANQTMDLIRKNKFLQRIKEELEKLRKLAPDGVLKEKIVSLIKKIDRDVDHKKQWEVFETAFDEVHEDFLTRIKTLYPNLTPKELRLCAYLRMNISTKEIAPLMNISVRGVEICRYRVRKKLNIDRDQNLTSMIIDL